MSVLRHLPAPASEPPYDDEHAGRGPAGPPSGAVQGTLALAFVLPSGLPAAPAPPPDLRLVPRPAAEDDADAVDFGPQPTPTAALPSRPCLVGPVRPGRRRGPRRRPAGVPARPVDHDLGVRRPGRPRGRAGRRPGGRRPRRRPVDPRQRAGRRGRRGRGAGAAGRPVDGRRAAAGGTGRAVAVHRPRARLTWARARSGLAPVQPDRPGVDRVDLQVAAAPRVAASRARTASSESASTTCTTRWSSASGPPSTRKPAATNASMNAACAVPARLLLHRPTGVPLGTGPPQHHQEHRHRRVVAPGADIKPVPSLAWPDMSASDEQPSTDQPVVIARRGPHQPGRAALPAGLLRRARPPVRRRLRRRPEHPRRPSTTWSSPPGCCCWPASAVSRSAPAR